MDALPGAEMQVFPEEMSVRENPGPPRSASLAGMGIRERRGSGHPAMGEGSAVSANVSSSSLPSAVSLMVWRMPGRRRRSRFETSSKRSAHGRSTKVTRTMGRLVRGKDGN